MLGRLLNVKEYYLAYLGSSVNNPQASPNFYLARLVPMLRRTQRLRHSKWRIIFPPHLGSSLTSMMWNQSVYMIKLTGSLIPGIPPVHQSPTMSLERSRIMSICVCIFSHLQMMRSSTKCILIFLTIIIIFYGRKIFLILTVSLVTLPIFWSLNPPCYSLVEMIQFETARRLMDEHGFKFDELDRLNIFAHKIRVTNKSGLLWYSMQR